ncbi:hypothetical protein DFH27DRAFT_557257 [Peziza echinospora]|nr:hypothetical protein DFH27DRAFT_557257 [Peziza echinospora]
MIILFSFLFSLLMINRSIMHALHSWTPTFYLFVFYFFVFSCNYLFLLLNSSLYKIKYIS